MVSPYIGGDALDLVLELIAGCLEGRINAHIPLVLLLVVEELLNKHGALEEEEFDRVCIKDPVWPYSFQICAHQIVPIYELQLIY